MAGKGWQELVWESASPHNHPGGFTLPKLVGFSVRCGFVQEWGITGYAQIHRVDVDDTSVSPKPPELATPLFRQANRVNGFWENHLRQCSLPFVAEHERLSIPVGFMPFIQIMPLLINDYPINYSIYDYTNWVHHLSKHWSALWKFNIAIEHDPLIVDLPWSPYSRCWIFP